MKKICTKCNKELPIDEFYNNPILKTGIGNICKRCAALERGITSEKYPEYFTCCICNNTKPYYDFPVTKKIIGSDIVKTVK